MVVRLSALGTSNYGNGHDIICIVIELLAGSVGKRGSIPGRGKRFFSSPKRPDRPPPSTMSIIFNSYRGTFSRQQSDRVVNSLAYLHTVSRLKMSGFLAPLPNTKQWRALGRFTYTLIINYSKPRNVTVRSLLFEVQVEKFVRQNYKN